MKNLTLTVILLLISLGLAKSQINTNASNYENLKAFELNFDTEKLRSASFDLSEKINRGLLSWNFNNIISLEPNAILLTNGGNDTYPLWVLQYAKAIREDVVVVSLDLIVNPEYRTQLFTEKKIPACSSNETKEILKHLLSSQHNRTIYLSSTIDAELRNEVVEYLYPTGLPLQYARSNFNNVALIQTNYEDVFMLDYLNNKLYATNSAQLEKANLHYLPSFILLEEHYLKQGEDHKAAKINWLMKNIAEDAGKLEEFDNYYTKKDKVVMYKRDLPFAELEKNLIKLKENLFVQNTELSNKWYNFFLDDLLYRKEYELVQKYGSKKADWESFLSQEEKELPLDKIYERGYPADDYLPVQNISKEAAMAFCEWLTERYTIWNGSKEFNKVSFHLPNKAQWQYAAKGNKSVTSYPWDFERDSPKKEKFNPKGPTNINGCYLGNFYSNSEEPCEGCPDFKVSLNSQDGGFFTVRVDSYWPNALGLYNCVGNVAEMTSDAGAMGGSWYNGPNESTIHHSQEINSGEPWIGFRIFMTINE